MNENTTRPESATTGHTEPNLLSDSEATDLVLRLRDVADELCAIRRACDALLGPDDDITRKVLNAEVMAIEARRLF